MSNPKMPPMVEGEVLAAARGFVTGTLNGLLAHHREHILDETPSARSSDVVVIARESGYRQGWNDAQREAARAVEQALARWELVK